MVIPLTSWLQVLVSLGMAVALVVWCRRHRPARWARLGTIAGWLWALVFVRSVAIYLAVELSASEFVVNLLTDPTFLPLFRLAETVALVLAVLAVVQDRGAPRPAAAGPAPRDPGTEPPSAIQEL